MKGFSGFKASPVKATDAGLVRAADLMDRGLEEPTSLVGEGLLGVIEGFNKSYMASKLTKALDKNEAYDNLPSPPKIDPLTNEEIDKTKQKQTDFQNKNKSEVELKRKKKPKKEGVDIGEGVKITKFNEVDVDGVTETKVVPASDRRKKRNRRKRK